MVHYRRGLAVCLSLFEMWSASRAHRDGARAVSAFLFRLSQDQGEEHHRNFPLIQSHRTECSTSSRRRRIRRLLDTYERAPVMRNRTPITMNTPPTTSDSTEVNSSIIAVPNRNDATPVLVYARMVRSWASRVRSFASSVASPC